MNLCRLLVSYFAIVCTLVGCAHQPTAQGVNYDGNVAYYSQRYEVALSKYQTSLQLAEQSADKQYAAIAMFGLARTYGQLCQVANAETWFKKSIAAREQLSNIQNAYITQNLLEFGRFLSAQGRTVDALPQYDRAMPLLSSVGMNKSDPLGYAVVFDEYELLLKQNGRVRDADVAQDEAKKLRAAAPGEKGKFKSEPYPVCSAQHSFMSTHKPNPAVERDGHKLRLWFPTLRSGCPSPLR